MLYANAKTQEKQHIGMVMVGIIAGAAGVTALALSDKDIRKKFGKRAKDLQHSLQEWSSEKLQMAETYKDKDSVITKTEKILEETTEEEPRADDIAINN